MAGSATFTIVASSTIISCARSTATSAAHRRRSPSREDNIVITAIWIITVSRVIHVAMAITIALAILIAYTMSPTMSPESPGSLVLAIRLSRLVYRRATEEVLGMRLKQFIALSTMAQTPNLSQ